MIPFLGLTSTRREKGARMRTRHIGAAALTGLVLAVSAAIPAHAVSSVLTDAPATAVAPSATVMSAVAARKPAKSPRKSAAAHKPHKATTARLKHSSTKPVKRAPSPPLTAATTRTPLAAVGPQAAVKPRTAGGSQALVGQTSPPPVSQRAIAHRDSGVLHQAVGTVHAVFTTLGWNLLALIPMAGIAFAISQRITSARRLRRRAR